MRRKVAKDIGYISTARGGVNVLEFAESCATRMRARN
jgi:hypothetical protein